MLSRLLVAVFVVIAAPGAAIRYPTSGPAHVTAAIASRWRRVPGPSRTSTAYRCSPTSSMAN